jgi:hypothetical protein
MTRGIMLLAGTMFSIFNLLPIPWSLRLVWMRLLYFVILKGTLIFPSILSRTIEQNVAYKMGKQKGEEYESLVQLEKVLEYLDKKGIAIERVRQAVNQAEIEAIPQEELGAFIARAIFDPLTAKQVLRESLQSTRY